LIVTHPYAVTWFYSVERAGDNVVKTRGSLGRVGAVEVATRAASMHHDGRPPRVGGESDKRECVCLGVY